MLNSELIKELNNMAFIMGRMGELRKSIILKTAAERIESQSIEINKLKTNNYYLRERRYVEIGEVKDRAIKEFADKMKEIFYFDGETSNGMYESIVETIDNLVKEMVGERE